MFSSQKHLGDRSWSPTTRFKIKKKICDPLGFSETFISWIVNGIQNNFLGSNQIRLASPPPKSVLKDLGPFWSFGILLGRRPQSVPMGWKRNKLWPFLIIWTTLPEKYLERHKLLSVFICFYFIHFSRLNSISIILFWENTGSASKNYQIFKISNHSRER